MRDFFNRHWRWIIIILIFCLVLLAYCGKASLSQRVSQAPLVIEETSAISLSADIVQEKINYPLRLRIPAIGVDARIEGVGLTSAEEMDVPKHPDDVAWFNLGSVPGEEGSAVIAGHFDDQNGQKAAFYKLKELSKDDKIFVEDIQGNVVTFIVREARLYDSEALVPEVFTSSDGRHLNLITCAGSWSVLKGEYTQSLVIFTDILTFN